MTPDETRLRLVETLDDLLLSFRRQLDDGDPTAVVPILSGLKATCLGIVPTRYDRGVVFGLDICHLNDLVSYSTDDVTSDGGGWTLPTGMFPWDYVVSPGTVYDGQKLVNIWGTEQTPYVHRILLPTTLRGTNFYTMGAIIYDCTSGTLSTRLLGGNDPPITVERADVTLDDMLRAALREDPLDIGFKVQPTATEIVVGRFLADVDTATADVIRFTLHTRNDMRRRPLSSGLPCEPYADLAVDIQLSLAVVDQPTFDTTSVYELMLEICDAATWGTSFYAYWTTPGRSLPANVKYYYNEIWGPPNIP